MLTSGLSLVLTLTASSDGATVDEHGDGGDRSNFGVAASTNLFAYWTAAELGGGKIRQLVQAVADAKAADVPLDYMVPARQKIMHCGACHYLSAPKTVR